MAVFDCTSTSLRSGSSGEKVKTLQTHLKTLGYYTRQVDGSFGPYTVQAVKSFQRAYKLSVDGWFGQKSCQKLNQVVESKGTTSTTNNNVQSTVVYLFDCPKISLKRGSKGDNVTTLQTMLKTLGYYTRQVDGDFGVFTEQAVKAYQKQAGHDPDGWFGPKTCATLNQKYSEKVSIIQATTKTAATQNKQVGYVKPDYLKKITYKLTVLPEVVVLPESEVDKTTATKTVTEGSITTEGAFDCSKISLKRGSNGAEVAALQAILKARGYYTRAIDSDFGKYTQEAVKKLQQAQGNTVDGWFGSETCKSLQSTNATSNEATGTSTKKNTNYVITDFQLPNCTDDIEGVTHEVTLKTPFTIDKLNHLRRLQKTQFDMYYEDEVYYQHEGYINELKITQEDKAMLLEICMVGYTVFLDTQVEFEKTAKRSELIKELAGLAGLKAEVNTTGLTDDEFTVKAVKETKTVGGTSGGGSGLVDVSGNDCSPTNPISGRSFDIASCGGGTIIGNSTANYAVDTKDMSIKEVIQDCFRRASYHDHYDNWTCPRKVWNKSGKLYANCADHSRLIKCLCDVHGVKCGIYHWTSGSLGHYFNLIEVNGKMYRFDMCFTYSGRTSSRYGGYICNNLTKNGGPWQV